MNRLLRFLSLLALLTVVAVPAAQAHEPTIVPIGVTDPIDLGTVSSPRLVHATLAEAEDQLTVTVRQRDTKEPLVVELLVPDRLPERDRSSATQPGLQVRGDGQRVRIRQLQRASADARVDEGTGLAYLERATATLSDGDWTITVSRGSEPVRVALRIGVTDAPFATTDPERVARTLTRVRAWYDTPAPGSELPADTDAGEQPRASAFGAVYGAIIALIALATAFWWIRTGLRRARARGVERSSRR